MVDMDLRLPGDPVRHPEIEPLDCYSLPSLDLDTYAGLIVPTMVDQEFLQRHRKVLRAYLDRRGVIAFSGHLHRPWLPGAGLFEPKRVRTFRDYEVRIVADHPVFAGVQDADLTYRRGVAGFFARGYHRPPPGAQVLVEFTSGEPVVYVDEVSTAGTLLVHAGNDLVNLAGDGSSASRVGDQLVSWIRGGGGQA
ncbi:MAG: phosphate starvation-inducible protein PhoH [Nitriliruptorales bacterium]